MKRRKKPTKKNKKPVKKNRGRKRTTRRKLVAPYIYRRYHSYGIDYAGDWEEYDSSRVRMLCINCYGQFYMWAYDRFKVYNWFCDDCRVKISKRRWALITRFHKYMEAARFRKTNPVDLSQGDVLGFTNSLYRCIRGKASRETVIKTMKLAIDLAKYADPIILGGLLDRYDKLVGIQAKKRNER